MGHQYTVITSVILPDWVEKSRYTDFISAWLIKLSIQSGISSILEWSYDERNRMDNTECQTDISYISM